MGVEGLNGRGLETSTGRNLVQFQQNGLERPAQEGDSPVCEEIEHFSVEYPKYFAISGTA